MNKIIYLDHAAATPIDKKVLVAMRPYFSDDFFNPSSPYAPAVKVRRDYESAKQEIANLLGAKSNEIVITAGATESINLAFSGVNGHVVTTAIEHYAVLASAELHEHTLVAVDERGMVSPIDIKKAIKPSTQLVSVALANNELGTVQPIREIATVVQQERQKRLEKGDKTPIYFHTDASQAPSQLDCNVAKLGVDMMTLNAGKIYGPKQVGLLYAASNVRLNPLIVGGGQEQNMRSGTENVAGTVGFAKALSLATTHRKSESERLASLRDQLQSELVEAFSDAIVSGHPKHRLSSHLHISFPGIDAERLVFALENRSVYVATGSACAANKGARSHVLTAIGLSPEVADGSLRLTLGHLSSQKNTTRAAQIIIEEIKKEYERIKK